jgi:sfeI restriction endonuclease
MDYIDEQLIKFKNKLEEAILKDGSKGKESIIRSSELINFIHDAVKFELINEGVNENNIFPPLGKTKPELKIAGFLKQKNQDICVVPSNIQTKETSINWGPLKYNNKIDKYGIEYSTNTLVINVRSQMSSIEKNKDTLFERTFAEPLNLRMIYPNIVLGEVYLIPLYEYDENSVKLNRIGFKNRITNLASYISFFDAINNKEISGEKFYDRCSLLIVDFNRETPYLFKSTAELKEHGYLSDSFNIEYSTLNFKNFAKDILKIYKNRYNLCNLLK